MRALLLLLLLLPSLAMAQVHFDKFDRSLDCSLDPCAQVLPGAVTFEPTDKPWVAGLDAQGELVGWVVLSTDVVDLDGYSGKPLVTAIGLDTAGVIAGARVIHHSEPILLVGIPEQELHDFVDTYAGTRADGPVVVGGKEEGARSVDIVSGATVTVLAENRTILDSARLMGAAVGVVEASVSAPGEFVQEGAPWTWAELTTRGALQHLSVTHGDMEVKWGAATDPFVDLWFGLADARPVGEALLGANIYQRAMDRLKPGEHLLVVLGNGSGSFKGSGFVRGGIFDRIQLEQGLSSNSFRDHDYTALGTPPAAGAPRFKEGGLFVVRGGLDPGRPFELVFLGSAFTGHGGIERDFKTFKATLQVPEAVYIRTGPDPDQAVWRGAWKTKRATLALVVPYLLLVFGVFAGRRWSAGRMDRLKKLHIGFLTFSFVVLGLGLSLQPSITQLFTLADGVVREWRWGLFLSDPLLFVSWTFIAITTLVWGRGVFCGWVCPYGAMSELIYKVARKLKIPEYEMSDVHHERAKFIRYGVLFLLVATVFASPQVGERLAEIEPFKSTFFVSPFSRPLFLTVWWVVLLVAAVFTYRPFCRYLCPLGAALALPSSFRLSGPYRRDFCATGCRICPRGCEPRAIRKDGSIDSRECLNCWECEATYHDDQRCPPLVQIRRRAERQAKADA